MHAVLFAPPATLAGLALALLGPLLFAFIKHGDQHAPLQPWRHLGLTWGGCLALLALVLLWERQPLASIGIAWGNYPAWAIGALLGLTLLTTNILSVHLSFRRGEGGLPAGSADGLRRVTATPAWFRCAAVLTAGITEEIIFRGYPIERLQALTGNLWLAALLPLAVFVLAHLGAWSLSHLVGVLFGGVLLTGLYLWRRDLIACMIAHVLIDAIVIFLPRMLKRYAAETAARGG